MLNFLNLFDSVTVVDALGTLNCLQRFRVCVSALVRSNGLKCVVVEKVR